MYHFYSVPSISHGGIQDAINVKESTLATFWEKVKPETSHKSMTDIISFMSEFNKTKIVNKMRMEGLV